MCLFCNSHTHKESSEKGIEVINLFPDEYPYRMRSERLYSIGIHPWYADAEYDDVFLKKVSTAAELPQVVAIGETGIDRVRGGIASIEYQKKNFIKHIEISVLVEKPMILHCVKAYSDVLQLRKQYFTENTWVLHGFNANRIIANQLIKSGCALSFGPEVLNINSNAAKAAAVTPVEYLLVETDNSDTDIEQIYMTISKLKNIQLFEMKQLIENNFKRIFRL